MGGYFFEPLINFVKDNAVDTDIFCFQEIFDAPGEPLADAEPHIRIFSELAKFLSLVAV